VLRTLDDAAAMINLARLAEMTSIGRLIGHTIKVAIFSAAQGRNVMKRFGLIGRGIAIATLLCFAAPQAEAIEVYGPGNAVTQLDDGLIVQVRGGRGGGAHRHGGGGMHRGGGAHRGGMHHGVNRGNFNRSGHVAHRGNFHGANRNVNRNINRNVNRNINRNVNVNRNVHVNRNVYRAGHWGNWARPGWYRWNPGGAIAAGAALGFVSAAAAASWAGAAPGPNLCWYYTDPSRRQGFWDACP
jgi:hypothetical protein